jgi:hypothetical protein
MLSAELKMLSFNNLFISNALFLLSWGSTVGMVPDYRLDDWASIPCRGKEFFL